MLSDPVGDPRGDPVGDPRGDPVGDPRSDPRSDPRGDPIGETLTLDGELESQDSSPESSRPPASVRNGPGGFDISGDFGESLPDNRENRSNIREKEDTPGISKGSLMAAAMAMQKEREG